MEVHSIYGDYLECDGLSWGWEHTAVYYMGELHKRGHVKFAEMSTLATHDYRAPAFAKHMGCQMFTADTVQADLMSRFDVNEMGSRIMERVNDPKHPEFDESQRLLGLWLPAACEICGCEMHDFMSDDQTRLHLDPGSCLKVFEVVYGVVVAKPVEMPSLNPTVSSTPTDGTDTASM